MRAPLRKGTLLVFASLSLFASNASAETGHDGPPSFTEAERKAYPPPSTRYKIIGAGALTTGAFYGAAAGMSFAFPDAPGAKDLRIPIAGPWMAIANNGCPPNEPDCSRVWVAIRTILTAIDGLGQAAGLGIILEGIFLPTQEAIAESPPTTRPRVQPEAPESLPGPLFYLPTPTVMGQHGVGVSLGGIF